MANPASVFCETQGYKLEIRTDANGGQSGYCVFGNGKECEEWKFYRRECGSEYIKNLPTPTVNK
jgi:putative hemolysin